MWKDKKKRKCIRLLVLALPQQGNLHILYLGGGGRAWSCAISETLPSGRAVWEFTCSAL